MNKLVFFWWKQCNNNTCCCCDGACCAGGVGFGGYGLCGDWDGAGLCAGGPIFEFRDYFHKIVSKCLKYRQRRIKEWKNAPKQTIQWEFQLEPHNKSLDLNHTSISYIYSYGYCSCFSYNKHMYLYESCMHWHIRWTFKAKATVIILISQYLIYTCRGEDKREKNVEQ